MPFINIYLFLNPYLRICLLIFEGEEKKRERDTCMWETSARCLPYLPRQDQAHNRGMCRDRRQNPWPFGVWDNIPTNWATWPGTTYTFHVYNLYSLNITKTITTRKRQCIIIYIATEKVLIISFLIPTKWKRIISVNPFSYHGVFIQTKHILSLTL